MEFVTLILGIVAIAISVFAIAISWILYNKSDKLNKEMRDFLIEIRTVTGKMYTDSFGLVKESYEKFISQGIGESRALADDKIVTDIIDNVSNKVEEKFIKELERIKTGEKVRDDELDRLKSELEGIIKKIPARVDESKKAIMNDLKLEIIDIVEENTGIPPSQIMGYESLVSKYGKNTIMEAVVELVSEEYLVGIKGVRQSVDFYEPMKVTGKRL